MDTYKFKIGLILIFGVISFLYSSGQSIGPQIISNMSLNFNQANGQLNCVVGDIATFSGKDTDDNTLSVGYIPCIVYVSKDISVPVNINIDINVYPNPTNEVLFIDLNYPENFIQIEIIDILGKQLFSEKYTNPTDKLTINISDFSNGSYLLLFKDQKGNNLGQYKIIKQ